MQPLLITPYGGKLVNLLLPHDGLQAAKKEMVRYPPLILNQRQLCDLELLMSGSFSPLTGFMGKEDYERVVNAMRLKSGAVWPIPIIFDISEKMAADLKSGQSVSLYEPEGFPLAILRVTDVWKANKRLEALKVYGTETAEHPGVAYLYNQTQPYYIGGKVDGISLPDHYDFLHLRKTPVELRKQFAESGLCKVVGFQTRNPMHRAHKEITLRAMEETGAHLLIHPVVGQTKPGDVDHSTRVRCYQQISKTYPENTATLSLLHLAMRMAGPREALWHAIIRRNYGCSHFIVGRDHAGPGKDSSGKNFYDPYAAQELVESYQKEIGVQTVKMKEVVRVKETGKYLPIDEVPEGKTILQISGTELRRRLQSGEEIPEWFSYPELIDELRKAYPPPHQRGIMIFLTGLSGSGKSTIANHIYARFMEKGDRPVTLLDGDIVRKYLSSELGFSKEHRDLNVLRVSFVASEIVKNRGVAISALIAPYQETRKKVRELIRSYGEFIEIYIATPLEVCEARDRKGLYAKARAGLIKNFTGIDDVYEAPSSPEIVIDTSGITPSEATQKIFDYLAERGFINS